jgi:hypothetical protein
LATATRPLTGCRQELTKGLPLGAPWPRHAPCSEEGRRLRGPEAAGSRIRVRTGDGGTTGASTSYEVPVVPRQEFDTPLGAGPTNPDGGARPYPTGCHLTKSPSVGTTRYMWRLSFAAIGMPRPRVHVFGCFPIRYAACFG